MTFIPNEGHKAPTLVAHQASEIDEVEASMEGRFGGTPDVFDGQTVANLRAFYGFG